MLGKASRIAESLGTCRHDFFGLKLARIFPLLALARASRD
jgi:hypothetical protein